MKKVCNFIRFKMYATTLAGLQYTPFGVLQKMIQFTNLNDLLDKTYNSYP